MASQIRTILIDDLDDTEIPEGKGQTVSFSVGTSRYEIDLNDANLGKLYDALEPFTTKARRLRGSTAVAPGGSAKPRTTPTDRLQLQAMRDWATSNGYSVSNRGRVSQEVQDAYHAAH